MLSRDEELALHQRLLAGDAAATDECIEQYFPLLHAALARKTASTVDPHLVEQITGDSLLTYVRSPERYRPDSLSLLSYLRMDASGDLKNALATESRRRSHLTPLDPVEHALPVWNTDQQDDEIELPPGVERGAVLDELWRRVTDPRDRAVLRLRYVEGERSTEAFARSLGLDHLDRRAQEREVKKVKDRLDKTLRRIGERYRGNATS